MTRQTFQISDEGNTFIDLQINKYISFLIIQSIILLVISSFTMFTENGITYEKMWVGIGIFTFLFVAHLTSFLKGTRVRGRLIKEFSVVDEKVIITVYSAFNSSENVYTCDKKECFLQRGIAKETNKSINIFEVPNTYSLIIKRSKFNFYFISSYWQNWPEITDIFDNN